MRLFLEERDLAEKVITEVRRRESPANDDPLPLYQERFGTNLYETLRQIRNDHPKRAGDVLTEITECYDGFVDAAVARYPRTIDVCWQNYRRNQSKFSTTVFPDEHRSDSENDRQLAQNYRVIAADGVGGAIIQLDAEPQLQFIDWKPERAMGLGVYVFKKRDGRLIDTIWDLRETEIPRFRDANRKYAS